MDNRIYKSASSICNSIFESKEKALEYLNDTDPKRRKVAIFICQEYYHLGASATFVRRCTEIAKYDLDPGVRITAFQAIGSIFSGTGDKQASCLLAEITKNANALPLVQMASYIALQEVQFGRTDRIRLQYQLAAFRQIDQATSRRYAKTYSAIAKRAGVITQGQLEDAEKIDWKFVNRFNIG